MPGANHPHSRLGLLVVFCVGIASSGAFGQTSARVDWPYYGNDPGGMRYSGLTQINRDNVSKLKIAWVSRTGDVSDGTKYPRKSEFESTPIFVGSKAQRFLPLVGSSATTPVERRSQVQRVIAIRGYRGGGPWKVRHQPG